MNSRRLKSFHFALLAATLACAADSRAAALNVGDSAPPLKTGRWVKGEPVKEFKPGTIYILEFWATWCGPCKASMPHLSKLQAKHPEIVIIAQNVGEEDKEASKVEAWVASLGDGMNLRVATDDRSGEGDGAMYTTYNQAAQAETLPATFVIDQAGKIAWIGKPMDVEPVIEQLLAGTFDRDAAKKTSDARNAQIDQAAETQAAFNDAIGPFLSEKDYVGAAKAIDAFIAAHPETKPQLIGVKFGVLIKGERYDDAYATADVIAADAKDEPQILNALASAILGMQAKDHRDLDRAERYANAAVAVSGGTEASFKETLSQVQAQRKQ